MKQTPECLRKDNAKNKRVELNMHTNFSDMDGVSPPRELIRRAFAFGHRAVAVTDHGNVQAFPAVMEAVEEIRAHGGEIKPIYGMEAYFVNDSAAETDLKKLPFFHITILVKNKVGLKNLYKLVSLSYNEYFCRKPIIPFSEMEKHREGLIISSGCANGELFRAILEEKSPKIIDEIAEKYDYFEIQPAANNLHKKINKKITELAEKHGKLCAATGNVHLKNEDDGIFRKIIRAAEGDKNADNQMPLFFRTTDEMLSEFEYLGAEKAFEVVITNTNAIADKIDADIRPIPKGSYMPTFPGAEEQFSHICWENAHVRYGNELPEIVENRLKRELELISKYGYSAYYMTGKRLAEISKNSGYPVSSHGAVGSSLAAFVSGITDIDPLPPYYICPKCRYSEFITDGSVNSGFDLPHKDCPNCGCIMARDGQDIPFETFMGYNGWNAPDIDLDFSPEILDKVKCGAQELFGENRVFTTGRTSSVQPEAALGYVKKYCGERRIICDEKETERLAEGCVHIKRTTSQSPGGLIIIPEGYEVCDFTPIDRPIVANGILPTHFDRNDLRGILPITDVLGNIALTLYKRLEDMTGVKISDVPVDDPLVYRLFTSTEPLGLSENIGVKCGTLGIPGFGSDFVMQMMIEANPKTFSDIVKISGLSHGKNTWNGNARELIRSSVCELSDVIATRDDVMLYLMRKGIDRLFAYNIAKMTQIGSAAEILDNQTCKEFAEQNISEWFSESCKKISHLCPKAQAVIRAAEAVKLAWFKLHYPAEFYAAMLKNHVYNLKRDVIKKGLEAVKSRVEELQKSVGDSGSSVEKSRLNSYLLVWEAMSRGVEILGTDNPKF